MDFSGLWFVSVQIGDRWDLVIAVRSECVADNWLCLFPGPPYKTQATQRRVSGTTL